MNRILRNIANNAKLILALIILIFLIIVALYPTFSGKHKKKEKLSIEDLEYSVTLNLENGTLDSNEQIVKSGVDAVFNYTLTEGYSLNDATKDCDIEFNDTEIIVKNIKKDTVCNIVATKPTYSVSLAVENGTTEEAKQVEIGGSASFVITPNEGYELVNPGINCENSSYENGILTINEIYDNKTCSIVLNKKEEKPPVVTYTAKINVINGSSSNSITTVNSGSTASFKITPSEGYSTSTAKVTCTKGNSTSFSGNTLKIKNVKSDTECTVELGRASLKITLNITGITNTSTDAYVNYGDDVTIFIQNKSTSAVLYMDPSTISCSPSLQFENPVWDGANKWLSITYKNVKSSSTCTGRLEKR